MSDVADVAKRLLLGKSIIEQTRLENSRNVKFWVKTTKPRKDKKQLKNLCKYLALDKNVEYKFSIIDLPGDEYDFSVMEMLHGSIEAANGTMKRFEELKGVVGL